jgi:malonyl CoA-acyl carrier protein transacylase
MEFRMKAYMFPGQGSQHIGMGKGLFERYQQHTEEASDILGYSIENLCISEGRLLSRTEYTQPALFTVNALTYLDKVERSGNDTSGYFLGHSLGEYNALWAAGAISFSQGLQLVKLRGELMANSPAGGMAAVLGCDADTIRTVLNRADLNDIDVANYNSQRQTVISGPIERLAQSQKLFEDTATYIPLNTSGAFHSWMMRQSEDIFRTALEKQTFSPLRYEVIANLTARPYRDEMLVDNLSKQMSSPVKWLDSILYLAEQGVILFEEVGPGTVLTKIVANILSHNDVANVELDVDCESGVTTPTKNSVTKQTSVLNNKSEADTKVQRWNSEVRIGDLVVSKKFNKSFETRSHAMILFEKKPVVYLRGLKGYFELDDLSPQPPLEN